MADTTPRAQCPNLLATVLLLVLVDSVAAEALGEASIAAVSVAAGEEVDSEEIVDSAAVVALATRMAHHLTALQQVLVVLVASEAVAEEAMVAEDTMIEAALGTPTSNHYPRAVAADDTTIVIEIGTETTTAARSDHTKAAATTTRDKDADTRLTLHTREQDGKTSPCII